MLTITELMINEQIRDKEIRLIDENGEQLVDYTKIHPFSYGAEAEHYVGGNELQFTEVKGVPVAPMICYDLRFPELTRALALRGTDMLFVVSQWPEARISHLKTLCAARAIENQVFLVNCNGCGSAGQTRFGGNSAVYDPWGQVIAQAGSEETTFGAECDFSTLPSLRNTIPVFTDRRQDLY